MHLYKCFRCNVLHDSNTLELRLLSSRHGHEYFCSECRQQFTGTKPTAEIYEDDYVVFGSACHSESKRWVEQDREYFNSLYE
jgi:DNA-directed RNA polymerase subunit RPC12/RpoP